MLAGVHELDGGFVGGQLLPYFVPADMQGVAFPVGFGGLDDLLFQYVGGVGQAALFGCGLGVLQVFVGLHRDAALTDAQAVEAVQCCHEDAVARLAYVLTGLSLGAQLHAGAVEHGVVGFGCQGVGHRFEQGSEPECRVHVGFHEVVLLVFGHQLEIAVHDPADGGVIAACVGERLCELSLLAIEAAQAAFQGGVVGGSNLLQQVQLFLGFEIGF